MRAGRAGRLVSVADILEAYGTCPVNASISEKKDWESLCEHVFSEIRRQRTLARAARLWSRISRSKLDPLMRLRESLRVGVAVQLAPERDPVLPPGHRPEFA